jgi:hypothetical protein
MTELAVSLSGTKNCPICSRDLPLTDYGICRARKDGHNLYCKSCIRKKVSDSRKAFKAYKTVRHQYVVQNTEPGAGLETKIDGLPARRQYVTRQVSKMTPAERVREAIKNGARTQAEIGRGTRLGKDEIGDALANLLLWSREIRTEVIESERMYFINEVAPEPAIYREDVARPRLPPRKRDVPSSFSAVQDLMPGKKGEGEPERAPGWVAA